jgi:hypothetical protein
VGAASDAEWIFFLLALLVVHCVEYSALRRHCQAEGGGWRIRLVMLVGEAGAHRATVVVEEGEAQLASTKQRQLKWATPDNSEELPAKRAVERASFNETQPGSLEFSLAWSKAEAEKEAAEHACRLGLCVVLDEDDDDVGLSERCSDDGQGCNKAPKDEPPSDDDDDTNNDIFYKRLGLQ